MLRIISTVVSLLALGCGGDDGGSRRVILKGINDLSKFSSDERRQLEDEYRSLPRTLVVRAPATSDSGEGGKQGLEAEVRQYSYTLDLNDKRAEQVWGQGKNSGFAELAHNIRHSGKHWGEQMRSHTYGRSHSRWHRRHHHSRGHYRNHGNHSRGHYRNHGNHGRGHYRNHGNHGRGHYRNYRRAYYPTSYYYQQPYYSYYQPYYRSAWRNNLWWDSYRYYDSYSRPGSRYRYYVYYPNSYYYSTNNRYCITACY